MSDVLLLYIRFCTESWQYQCWLQWQSVGGGNSSNLPTCCQFPSWISWTFVLAYTRNSCIASGFLNYTILWDETMKQLDWSKYRLPFFPDREKDLSWPLFFPKVFQNQGELLIWIMCLDTVIHAHCILFNELIAKVPRSFTLLSKWQHWPFDHYDPHPLHLYSQHFKCFTAFKTMQLHL